MGEKDIRNTFSHEEKELYQRFFDYFTRMCELYPKIKKNYDFRYEDYEHKTIDIQTDEKLTSAAFTLACTRTKPVILISKDSDIKKMRWFFHHNAKYQEQFGIREPSHKFQLYSDFNEGNGFKPQ